MMMPRTIFNHPAVDEVREADGIDGVKYDVILKAGYCWLRGRNAGGTCGFFSNVKDFIYWRPVTVEFYQQETGEA
tara:strand:- start:42 stop:266 length:225 start_codon:yes stop_codon:yes gene_type:complete